ncbi:hypothetical protein EYF80_036103 [Liparis tanakae]|uniref:Uncharacterized protein n=1 Tax=Liparis tanakae TaxID=230148 RepID=A0A4Z2GJL6_9TELE|nr:hypothetical protein EYF80_036103 [Liparis tanakae]
MSALASMKPGKHGNGLHLVPVLRRHVNNSVYPCDDVIHHTAVTHRTVWANHSVAIDGGLDPVFGRWNHCVAAGSGGKSSGN